MLLYGDAPRENCDKLTRNVPLMAKTFKSYISHVFVYMSRRLNQIH